MLLALIGAVVALAGLALFVVSGLRIIPVVKAAFRKFFGEPATDGSDAKLLKASSIIPRLAFFVLADLVLGAGVVMFIGGVVQMVLHK